MAPPIRVEMTRGQGVECVHSVNAVIVDAAGKVIDAWGDRDFATYLRSSAKPLQAVPVVETGAADHFQLSDDELALCCASHAGADVHVQAVRSILRKAGLSAEFLQCRVHPDVKENAFCCSGPTESLDATLRHNCSGKHAGMLVAARLLHESLDNYREPAHPAQQRVFKVVSDLAEIQPKQIEDTVVPDGCGAPIFQLPLRNLALAYAKYGGDHSQHVHAKATRRLRDAMRQHPVMVSGTGSWNTLLLLHLGEFLFAKGGAEGVFGLGLRTGIGIATKVLDGNHRASSVALLAILRRLELVPLPALARLTEHEAPTVVNGHQVPVGVLRAKL